ncbi:hypothetical protein [Tunturibacter empetritectus]|uniref:Uncharacterized protein n=1 Tax=Tunturiibacter empetritectus TaxID=3069691 RepID=A0A7W8IGM8_9BACT|nr:hypothetical protein [Edaphobacter lichenicola]MBB5316834.1 hypothetical protein [Edaphobacter lichenicola]
MKSLVWAITKMASKYAIALSVMHYLGGLNWLTGLSIAIFLPLYLPWSSSNKVDISHFTPHIIDLNPHIASMLIDLGLITDEKWKQLVSEDVARKPWDGLSFAVHGIRGVVLSVDPNGDNVVHWTGWDYYTTQTMIEVPLDFVQFSGAYFPWSPRFFFRTGKGGYHLGIEVNDTWLKEKRKDLEQSGIVKEFDTDYRFGTTRLTLDVLPPDVFWKFYREHDKKQWEAAKQKAISSGWKPEEIGIEEIGYFGDRYEGKYGTVNLRFMPDGR